MDLSGIGGGGGRGREVLGVDLGMEGTGGGDDPSVSLSVSGS